MLKAMQETSLCSQGKVGGEGGRKTLDSGGSNCQPFMANNGKIHTIITFSGN